MKFPGKKCLIIILKARKMTAFPSLENAVLENKNCRNTVSDVI